MNRATTTTVLSFAALVSGVSGCASAPDDAGFDAVRETTTDRTGHELIWASGSDQQAAINAAMSGLLQGELTADNAVQVALLSNGELQATFEELGIARAELIRAGLLDNPVLGLDFRFFDAGLNVEGGLTQNILSGLRIPLRRAVAENEFEATKLHVSGQVIALVNDISTAYWEYQSQKQLVNMFQQVVAATEGSYDAAVRFRQAGNITKLELFRERALFEQSKVDLNAATERQLMTREHLNELMGLWGSQTAWETPPRLPDLPDAEPALHDPQAVENSQQIAGGPTADGITRSDSSVTQSVDDEMPEDRFAQIERAAIANSLELAAARFEIEAEAARLKLNVSEALFPFLDAGITADREPGSGEWGLGPAIGVPIPIFDQGQAARPEGESRIRQRLQQYRATAIRTRAVARAAAVRLQTTRARAAYYRNVVLPLQVEVVEQSQRQFNAMQIGVFRLLEDKRMQIETGQRYIEALHDYWDARSNLNQVVNGMTPAPGSMNPGNMMGR